MNEIRQIWPRSLDGQLIEGYAYVIQNADDLDVEAIYSYAVLSEHRCVSAQGPRLRRRGRAVAADPGPAPRVHCPGAVPAAHGISGGRRP